jgi:hypothetical protein
VSFSWATTARVCLKKRPQNKTNKNPGGNFSIHLVQEELEVLMLFGKIIIHIQKAHVILLKLKVMTNKCIEKNS